MKLRTVAILFIVFSIIVILLTYDKQSSRTTMDIEYRITGTSDTVSITMENASGGTEQYDSRRVPYSYEFVAQEGQFLYISAQNNGERGTVTCEIVINGVVEKEATSQGAYVIASCSGRFEY